MKVGFITTINTNIGDDFIRQGIINIIQTTYNDRTIEFVNVNKHHPFTAYPWWHPLRYFPYAEKVKRGKRIREKLRRRLAQLGGSKFDSCDLIIQSGAPVLWPDCQKCEWNIPIWQDIVGRLHNKIPVFNIAAGSCYPWEGQPKKIPSSEEESYARLIGNFCKLTTTRDVLANSLFDTIGINTTLLPCTAFFIDKHFANDRTGEYILINYMTGGGHFDWGQGIDHKQWENTIRDTINHLKRENEVRFICHDEKEVQLARQIDPSLKVHFPKTIDEYLICIKSAKFGINNRMHASVAMASVGVPAISVCTDTRLLMLKNIEFPVFYVKDINSKQLISVSELLLETTDLQRDKVLNLKRKSFDQYCQLFKKHFI